MIFQLYCLAKLFYLYFIYIFEKIENSYFLASFVISAFPATNASKVCVSLLYLKNSQPKDPNKKMATLLSYDNEKSHFSIVRAARNNIVFTRIAFLRIILSFLASEIIDMVRIHNVHSSWRECAMEYMEEAWKKLYYDKPRYDENNFDKPFICKILYSGHNLLKQCIKFWPIIYDKLFLDPFTNCIHFHKKIYHIVFSFNSPNKEIEHVLLHNIKKQQHYCLCFEAAYKTNRPDIVEFLIKRKILTIFLSLKIRISFGRPLFAIISVLLDNGFDPNYRNDDNWYAPTPLFAWIDNDKLVELLLEHGADPNITNSLGETALYCVSNLNSAKLLIKYGADVNAKTKDGYTPLDHAIALQKNDIVNLLRENGGLRRGQ